MTTIGAVLILAGAVLAFGGALGLVRLKSFYERVHPPTMGTTLGTVLVAGGATLCALPTSGLVLHGALITLAMLIATPVSFTLLVAAARRRRKDGDAGDDKSGAA